MTTKINNNYTLSHLEKKDLGSLLDSVGISINSLKESHLMRRLRVRMMRNKCDSLSQYITYARSQKKEQEELRLSFSINVTRFFRDADTFEFIKKKLIPTIISNNSDRKKIKIWSAGCADGAEPYGLAIICNQSNLNPLKAKIIASDYNNGSIKMAEEGIYPQEYLRELPEIIKTKYFRKISSDKVKIAHSLKQYIDFKVHNMISQEIKVVGQCFDLIVCRNVFIYFTRELQQILIQKFHNSLNSGGFLVLGRTETLSPFSWEKKFFPFDPRHRAYKKI